MAHFGDFTVQGDRNPTQEPLRRVPTTAAIVLTLNILFLESGIPATLAEPVERKIGAQTFKLEPLVYETFDQDMSHWLPEGGALVNIRRGFLQVDATEAPATIWYKEELSGPQVVEYDVRLMGDSLDSNINMFLLADTPNTPGSIGTGRYKDYHSFPNYLITILNATSPEQRLMLRVRSRLNPGFELAGENWFAPLQFGRFYHIIYILQPPRVSVYIDDRLVGETVYKRHIHKGRHALRIWRTHSVYDNFRISRILE